MTGEGWSRSLPTLLVFLMLIHAVAGPAWAEHGLPDPDLPPNPTPWPKFHADLRNTAQSTRLGPDAPNPKWTYLGTAKVLGSPAIASDGTIYITLDWSICAIRPGDGGQRWCTQFSADVSQSSPAVDKDGTIYVGARDNRLWALNPDGSVKFFILLGSEGDIRSSPSIGPDGTVYFAFAYSGTVTALNPDGHTTAERIKWQYTVSSPIVSSPALAADGTIYIASKNGVLHALKPDGTYLWGARLGANLTFSSPAVAADGTIYIGSNGGLSAVNPNGTLKWPSPFKTLGSVADSSPAIATDGTIYVGSKSGQQKTFYAVNPNGTLKWSFGPVPVEQDQASTQAIGADGIVYAGIGWWVYAFSPDSNVPLWQIELGGAVTTSPAIGGTASPAAGGEAVLYVGARDGKLYAFSTARSVTPVNHPPVADAGPDQTVQPDQPVTFDGSASSDPDPGTTLTYSWNFGDGSTGNGELTTHSYAVAGVYTVTLTVSDGQYSASDTAMVTVGSAGPFTDQFERSDSTDLGNGWLEALGDLEIVAGRLRNKPIPGDHVAVQPRLASADQTVSADFASVNNSNGRWGVVLRYQDSRNYYVLYRRVGGSVALVISKVVNGVETKLASTAIAKPALNTFFRLTGHATGSTLALALGSITLTASDPTFGSGSPGLLLSTGGNPAPSHMADNFAFEIP
jgi:outer membrane protein assembly factor BamB/PKD repeat protein